RPVDVAELRAVPLFDGLADDQLARLLAVAEEVPFAAGTELFVQARPAESWWLLVDGRVSLSRRVGQEDTVVAVMQTPGQWAGGFRAWDPHWVYLATGRGVAPGRMLRVPAEALRAV